MGYIKKLKNNELVGGTDKHTIYPVTSTKAVFEEVTEGDKSSFKSQETINGDYDDRIKDLETVMPDTIKSITINGSTKTYTVDDEGNVDLTIYTVNPGDPDVPAMVNLVEKNRDDIADIKEEIGTDTTQNTLSGRITELETLVGGNEQGSVNQRIEAAVNALDVPTATITDSTGHVSVTLGETDGKINSFAVSTADIASAEALNTLDVYVHNIEEGNIVVKSSEPSLPDTGASANTVYRVAGTTTYSDYMWNGTTMVKMAEYNVDTLESQFGYYKWETASNTISITTSNQVAGSPIGSYVLTSGGSFKIKMTNKATGACTLNMNGKGVKTLLYNGDPVTSSNTWENDEVISVYYDGSVYQASNSMGGGSAIGKKKLTGTPGYVATNEEYVGEPLSPSGTPWRYIIYPVSEGDVLQISGTGGNISYLWAFADCDNRILSHSTSGLTATNLVITAPASAAYVILNSTSNNVYEWYYAKKGSVGAHEILTEPYLTNDWRIISIGQSYSVGEDVKTSNGQLLKVIKNVDFMNRTDTIAIGDLKCYAQNTYRAQKAIAAYNSTTVYSDGDYAIGFPSSYLINIDISGITISEDTNITVTIGDVTKTITVTSSSLADGIAEDIASNFTSIEGWTLTDNEDGTLTLKSNTVGANTITISSEVGETGLVITPTFTSGNVGISQYSEGTNTWTAVTLANYAADSAEIGVTDDTKIWQKVDASWLGTIGNGVVAQACIRDYLYEEENLPLSYFTRYPKKCINNGASANWVAHNNVSFYYKPVEPGQKFIIKANGTHSAHYAWLGAQIFNDDNIKSSKVPVYAPGYNTHIKIPIGQRSIVEAPAGAQYLYICQNFATNQNAGSVDYCLPEYIHTYNELRSRVSKFDEQELEKWEEIDTGGYNAVNIWLSNNVWISHETVQTKIIPLKEGNYMMSAKSCAARYAFLASASRVIGESIVYENSISGLKTLIYGDKYEFSVSSGSIRYLLLVSSANYNKQPIIYKYKTNSEILASIKADEYPVKDITNQIVGWFCNAGHVITNLGGGDASIKMGTDGKRLCLHLGALPKGALLRLRFDFSKPTQGGGYIHYYSTHENVDNTNYTFRDINGRAYYISGYTNHYDIVYKNEGYPYIGFNTNAIGAAKNDVWTISNLKLEILAQETIDQNVIGHLLLPVQNKINIYPVSHPVTLLHFSDLHGNTKAATGIRNFYEQNSKYITDMINTGDFVTNNIDDPSDLLATSRLSDALFAVGNHDQAPSGNVNTYTHHTSDSRKFNTFYGTNGEYINKWGVVRPENATYECYYYKDYMDTGEYSNRNIRLIVLDTSLSGQDEKDAIQLQWFIDTLADAGERGMYVVVAAHYPIMYNDDPGVPVIDSRTNTCTTFNVINTAQYDGVGIKVSDEDAAFVGARINEAYPNALDEFIATYPDKFICWICGHKHADYFYYPYGHPNILTVAITQSKTYNSDWIYEKEFPFSANLISFYPQYNIIKITRVGKNRDYFFRHIGTLSYSYKQKRVIYND